METRKDSLSALKLCRFCLSHTGSMQSLYGRSGGPKNSVSLQLKILSNLSIEVFPSDKMPSFICNRCRFFTDLCYKYKQICRQADETILQFVQHGAALEPMVWPPSLVKMFNYGAKLSPEPEVVKTVVEGGATVEVTSQDLFDSEEEGENVYNVKIGDGSDEGSSACVKIVTSKDDQGTTKEKSKHGTKDAEGDGRQAEDAGAGAGADGIADGRWACSDCEATYPLQQLLELHKMQKHRARTVSCDQCQAKFFSKNDLMTHQLRHSDEMPFECVACDKRFKRHILLKRHEKLMHSDLPQLMCPNCPATFLSHEELDAHQKKHTRSGERRFTCTTCDKKFFERGSLQRHKDFVHGHKPEFSCEYCPQSFSSVSKLTRHVRSHAGERPYPCKYCNKSFVKSHHYTRHVRLTHREEMGSAQFAAAERLRCEQCEDSFSSQDELIYHSAIHATQNLICPLCQEKFENVDAVTAHIRSHANGVEFMCELCELVFTTKEKLENHLTVAHDDEIHQELGQDESSMEMDGEEDEDDSIHVKEEDDHMVVEIKKADDFMLPITCQGESEEKIDNTIPEDSDPETTYTELSAVDSLWPTVAMAKKNSWSPGMATLEKAKPKAAPVPVTPKAAVAKAEKNGSLTASILRKAEEMKRKVVQQQTSETTASEKVGKKEKSNCKVESSSSGGASDKSLRLLEKELQELKRTNTRNEVSKTPVKPAESPRSNRRPPVHTPTLKSRSTEETKFHSSSKQQQQQQQLVEKKPPPRRAVKENKEPKESKDTKANVHTSVKEEKSAKINNATVKEEKETKDTPKGVVKNGAGDTSGREEDGVRRSTRPSKVKDYARMVRDRSHDDDSDDSDDAEYMQTDKTQEIRPKVRRVIVKPLPKGVKPPATRKRGRPRKEQPPEIPTKIKKDGDGIDEETKTEKVQEEEEASKLKEKTPPVADDKEQNEIAEENSKADTSKCSTPEQKPSAVLMSPSGQTLKKVPIKALPPGVRPMPLPTSARPMGPGEMCEMQIGKKMVKVQKIVMTKAEVEAMAKKGLLELKDGTMVLKQGIKLPSADPAAFKSTLVGDESGKESPTKREKEKATPTRCNLGEDA